MGILIEIIINSILNLEEPSWWFLLIFETLENNWKVWLGILYLLVKRPLLFTDSLGLFTLPVEKPKLLVGLNLELKQ